MAHRIQQKNQQINELVKQIEDLQHENQRLKYEIKPLVQKNSKYIGENNKLKDYDQLVIKSNNIKQTNVELKKTAKSVSEMAYQIMDENKKTNRK